MINKDATSWQSPIASPPAPKSSIMRSYLLKISVSVFVLLTFAASVIGAQPTNPAARPSAPLGLLRLKDDPKPGEAAKLSASKFAVDPLSHAGVVGAIKSRKDEVDVLELEAGTEWSRPLRGSRQEVTFVSFHVYCSQSTVIEIGGARLGLTASPIPGSLQLMFDDSATGAPQWRSLNIHLGTARYDGKSFATPPTLTVRLDPANGVWDLFSGSRIIADNLPLLAARSDNRQFTVKAGVEGAWVVGLILSDENPLYDDANDNGIDDAFERSTRGALLAADTPGVVRSALAQQWKASQRRTTPPALFVARPHPDRR